MGEEIVDEERVSMEEEGAMGSGEIEETGELEMAEAVEEGAPDEMVAAQGASAQQGNADINTESFSELIVPPDLIDEAKKAWTMLITAAGSKDAVGEALYSAFYEAAPSLHYLFVTPRAVQAMRIFVQINNFVNLLISPADLKNSVEALGFWHMSMDVTVPRCVVFRDCILDLFVAELGSKLTSGGVTGLSALLNYIAGAIVYCKLNFATRLRILNESWAIANDKGDKDKGGMATMEKAAQEEKAAEEAKAQHHEDSKDGKESGISPCRQLCTRRSRI
jgi:hypothetical protein